jgi:hypothetical protein
MRETCRLVLVLLSTALPIAVHAQQQGTGLELLPPNEYILIPKAKEAVTGTGVAEKGLLGGTTGNDKLIFGPHANFENDMPSAQAQGDGSNACAAFAVTTNKAYRIYIASGRKGVPNDYLQSPSFPYSAACRRRAGIVSGTCNVPSYIRDELDFMSEIGSLPLKEMSYTKNKCEDWVSHLKDGQNRSYTPYTALPDAPNAPAALEIMKNLLAAGNPIIMGFRACDEFKNPVGEYIRRLTGREPYCDSHAVVVVGYDSDRKLLRILNSWGANWGKDGKAWMSEEVFLTRYREGYVDQGPGKLNSYANSYTELARSTPPANGTYSVATAAGAAAPTFVQESSSVVITPDILRVSLRASIGKRVGREMVYDEDDKKQHPYNRRYLWLDVPEQYANQIKSVTYRLDHPTFAPFTTTKDESSIFLVWWKGWNCVDHATVEATLIDPSLNNERLVKADFNYCEISDDNPSSKQPD